MLFFGQIDADGGDGFSAERLGGLFLGFLHEVSP
jgi:hypothetical protein